MAQLEPFSSSLSLLPEDVWSLVAESAGLLVLKRILDLSWRLGWATLASTLQRVTFRRFECPAFSKPQSPQETIGDLMPHMGMFAQLNAEEVKIDVASNLMTPERLYLAARLLVDPENLNSFDYSVDREALETISWIKDWKKTETIVLVRSEENSATLGSFAKISSVQMRD